MKKTHKQMLSMLAIAGLSASVLTGCGGYDPEKDTSKKEDTSQCDPKKDKCEKRESSGGGVFWVPIGAGSTTNSGSTSGSSGVVSGGGSSGKASTSSGATSGSTSAPSSGIGNAKAPAGS